MRYLTDRFIQTRHDSVYPWGTFSVNVAGSALLGAVAAATASGAAPGWSLALLGTGLSGALTTFSTFSFETVRLLEEGSLLEAAVNASLSLVVGLLTATGSWALTSAVI